MRIETCYFCSHPVYPSKGITFIRNDAKAFRFCRSKCHKNFKMKRNPRKLKWTKPFRKSANKEMVLDSTLSFAARRNVPTRYSRELIATTLKTMQRVSEIQAKREWVFYKRRMAGNAAARREADRKLVQENQHMLPEVRARLSQMETDVGESHEIEGSLDEAPYAISLSAKSATQRKRQQAWVSDAMDVEEPTDPK
ncbi:ATPase-activating ribosome biosynthesis protein [Orbilia brochopaga]|uniref:Ribosome biogenesis protein RLP24 n=1 Tax=Orbilia brochopaga TaxID=3140254 RepID=A0AAV9TZ90_9PEZI